MALRRKPVWYERDLAVSLGVRGSTIPTTTWGVLVCTCRHRYGTGQKAYRELLGRGKTLTARTTSRRTGSSLATWPLGSWLPNTSIASTVFDLLPAPPRLVLVRLLPGTPWMLAGVVVSGHPNDMSEPVTVREDRAVDVVLWRSGPPWVSW